MSDQFSLNSRSLPLEQWDVIVAGGGPAGCAAATAAAREGARTLLLESTSCLGGMGTSGLVPAWCPFTDKERIIYGGIAEHVLKETLAGMPHLPADRFDWTPIDPERLKRVYDNLVTSAGAAVRFATMVTGVETDGDGRIEALLLASKWGLTAARAKVYVDATGDGDLAAWGGAPFKKGDESGDLQPATLCFTLSNVDTYAFEHIGTIKHGKSGDAAMRAIAASEKYPEIIDHHGCNSMIGPATVGFNSGHVWDVDNTDPDSITRGLIEGRKIAAAFRDACAEFCPATFGNAFLAATGSLMGIRETRRILGEYVLTHEDFVARKAFDDEIGRNCYFIDVHHKKKRSRHRSGRPFDGRPLQQGRVARHSVSLSAAPRRRQRGNLRAMHLDRSTGAGLDARDAHLPGHRRSCGPRRGTGRRRRCHPARHRCCRPASPSAKPWGLPSVGRDRAAGAWRVAGLPLRKTVSICLQTWRFPDKKEGQSRP